MESPVAGSQRLFLARLGIGLLQGLVLYILYFAHDHRTWPANDPNLFAPALLVFLYVPLIALQGLGNLRKRTLLTWVVVAAAVAAAFAFYDVWHAWPTDMRFIDGREVAVPHVVPSPYVLVFTAVFLFVAHALISCIETDRRIVPHYPVLFDLAWKLGVQVAIAGCFVGAFWIILWLGVALFEMIKLHFFRDFINHSWFAIPATALATAVSVHITDTRGALVRGVRTLALMLLGWLLPVIALIAFAFLISLVFTGLQPLWQTRTATALLLVATAVLVIHVNAAYQDGDPAHRPHHVLRVAGTLSSVMLVFIVAIAAYALWLRVDQYGWTVDRVYSAAVVLLAICFAVGYFVAALLPGSWLKMIETWNYLTTIVGLVVLFALFTPIADPVRISVDSQMYRLESGIAKPDKFDFAYLRWSGGRFGQTALKRLALSKDKMIAGAATAYLNNKADRPLFKVPQQASAAVIAKSISVYPKGKALPDSFLKQDWSKAAFGDSSPVPVCMSGQTFPNWHCDALLRDFDGDGRDEILLIYGPAEGRSQWWNAYLLKQDGSAWKPIASMTLGCRSDRAPLLDGKFVLAPPETSLPDLQIGERRLQFAPMTKPLPCP